mmetsp:Transcript_117849/g.251748  ORF Transcript_117849/g.251748 Transcript_117849/m.251748 type:complete len:105 (-) Transcript_117849:125-439(-)
MDPLRIVARLSTYLDELDLCELALLGLSARGAAGCGEAVGRRLRWPRPLSLAFSLAAAQAPAVTPPDLTLVSLALRKNSAGEGPRRDDPAEHGLQALEVQVGER